MRKCVNEELEENLVHWVYDERSKMLHVSHKMMWKAKSIFNKKKNYPATQDSFVASRGWCEKFM